MKNYTDEEFFNSPFRGVTTVLNTIFGNNYSKIPEHILKAAAERGTAVHKYIEDWLNWYNSDIGTEPHLGLEYDIYETNFKNWLDEDIKHEITPLYTEQKIINKKLNIKGIIDCIAIVNGRLCLIDWKTSSNLDLWSTECQLQLYYYMLLKGNKTEREIAKEVQELRVLSLTKTGYKWIKFDINKDLSKSLIYLWNIYFKDLAEETKNKNTIRINK